MRTKHRETGGLDKCIDGLPDTGSLDPIKPKRVQPMRMWRAVVVTKKKELRSKRMENLPTNAAG